MTKTIFGILLLCTLKTFGQSNQNDVRAVNNAMTAYFSSIANICNATTPYENAASGVLRDRIAGNQLPDDHDFRGNIPPDPFNPLANPNLNITDPNAIQLLTVFKKFASLNQHAFAGTLNHRVDDLALESIWGDLENDWVYLTLLGSSIVDLIVSAGTDVDAWFAALANIQSIASKQPGRKKLGGGDNASNGFISEYVETAQIQANVLLMNCAFDEQSYEGTMKAVLSSLFSNLHQLREQYLNRHNNWLNPGWQFTYESIMRATAIALNNISNCNPVTVKSNDNPYILKPKTYTKTIYTNHIVSKLKKGNIVGDFVYSVDTGKVEVPLDYQLSFKSTAAALCNFDRAAPIPLSSFIREPIPVTTATEEHRNVRMTVSNRTYRKLYKVWRRQPIDAAINESATHGK